jgi:ABC-type transport system substrate-binding protein
MDEAPIIPLYTFVGTFLYRPSVQGISPNAQSVVLFKNVWVDHTAVAKGAP